MYYVREKIGASNFPVREWRKKYQSRDSRHIGNREEYNGKRLGTNYIGGKRNSMVSFMFFNFPNEWGMGNLWMMFKKYGTVFDMYMVQRRLRNGQRYGFVRFKLVDDVNVLLRRLREIKIGEVFLKVFIAFNRRSSGGLEKEYINGGDNRKRVSNGYDRNKVRSHNRIMDERRFVDVVNVDRRDKNKMEMDKEEKKEEYTKQEEKNALKEEDEEVRRIEVNGEETNMALFNKCLIGEKPLLSYETPQLL
ncbi:transposon TX1 [Tanacetum coccineum]